MLLADRRDRPGGLDAAAPAARRRRHAFAAWCAIRGAWEPSACAFRSPSATSTDPPPSATPCAAWRRSCTWPRRSATSPGLDRGAQRDRHLADGRGGRAPGRPALRVLLARSAPRRHHRTRCLRAKALAEQAMREAELRLDRVRALDHLRARRPLDDAARAPRAVCRVMPVSGRGRAPFQPIWAEDVADLRRSAALRAGGGRSTARYELAGPETLSHERDRAHRAALARRRKRPLVHVPTPLVSRGLRRSSAVAGPSAFATWDEAELMEVSMTSARGAADAEAPRREAASGWRRCSAPADLSGRPSVGRRAAGANTRPRNRGRPPFPRAPTVAKMQASAATPTVAPDARGAGRELILCSRPEVSPRSTPPSSLLTRASRPEPFRSSAGSSRPRMSARPAVSRRPVISLKSLTSVFTAPSQ